MKRFVFLACFLVAVCSAEPLGWRFSPSFLPDASQPWNRTIANVPWYKQPNDHTCGPTSTAMLIDYFKKVEDPKRPMEVCTYLGACERGTGEDELLAAMKHYDFTNAHRQTGGDALHTAIANGQPVLAHIDVKANDYPRIYPSGEPAYKSYSGGHYINVVGLFTADPKATGATYVVCNDPGHAGLKYVRYTASSFNTAWAVHGDATLILH